MLCPLIKQSKFSHLGLGTNRNANMQRLYIFNSIFQIKEQRLGPEGRFELEPSRVPGAGGQRHRVGDNQADRRSQSSQGPQQAPEQREGAGFEQAPFLPQLTLLHGLRMTSQFIGEIPQDHGYKMSGLRWG